LREERVEAPIKSDRLAYFWLVVGAVLETYLAKHVMALLLTDWTTE